MNQYIIETEYAIKNLIELATKEESELAKLIERLAAVEARYKTHKWDFETSDLNEDFSDLYVMNAFSKMAKAGTEFGEIQREISSLQAIVGTRQSALQAICGAILQIAKQGISVVHGGLDKSPEGRSLGSLKLRDIIWQARNQAIHSEEGNFRQPVVSLFQVLELENGTDFSLSLHHKQSRAKQVVKLLGWISYDNYSNDMQSLLP